MTTTQRDYQKMKAPYFSALPYEVVDIPDEHTLPTGSEGDNYAVINTDNGAVEYTCSTLPQAIIASKELSELLHKLNSPSPSSSSSTATSGSSAMLN